MPAGRPVVLRSSVKYVEVRVWDPDDKTHKTGRIDGGKALALVESGLHPDSVKQRVFRATEALEDPEAVMVLQDGDRLYCRRFDGRNDRVMVARYRPESQLVDVFDYYVTDATESRVPASYTYLRIVFKNG